MESSNRRSSSPCGGGEERLIVNLVTEDPEIAFAATRYCEKESSVMILCSPTPLIGRDIQLWVAPCWILSDQSNIFYKNSLHRKFILYGPAPMTRRAFLLGAADYLKEPWDFEELYVRCLRLLSLDRLELPWGPLWLEGSYLTDHKTKVHISHSELILLHSLVEHGGRPVTRDFLEELLGGDAKSRRVDVHLTLLRKKILKFCPPHFVEEDPLPSIRGKGYIWRYFA